MAILGGIHRQNEGREVDQNTNTGHTNKIAARLSAVGTEAVERNNQAQHVKHVPDKDLLAVEGNYCQTATKNQEEEVIAHANLNVGDQLVGDKRRLVREHVVGGTKISDGKTTTHCRKDIGS